MNGKRFATNMPHLVALSFSPPLRPKRLRIIRWELPPTGKMKLYVDAAVGRFQATGGAVLRDDQRRLVLAICFALPQVSPLHAELLTLTLALIHYGREWDHIVVETDCYSIISMLLTPLPSTGFLAADSHEKLCSYHLTKPPFNIVCERPIRHHTC